MRLFAGRISAVAWFQGDAAELMVSADKSMLPLFSSSAALRKASMWYSYLRALYGSSVEDDTLFPINVSDFHLIFGEVGGEPLISALQNISVNTQLGMRTGKELRDIMECPTQPGEVYRCMVWSIEAGCFLDLPTWIFVYQGHPPPAGIASDTWTEVSHCSLPEESDYSWGTWFYAANGSGMWLNVGRTVVFENHQHAIQEMLHLDPMIVCHKGKAALQVCNANFPNLVQAGLDMGLDTIQFYGHEEVQLAALVLRPASCGQA